MRRIRVIRRQSRPEAERLPPARAGRSFALVPVLALTATVAALVACGGDVPGGPPPVAECTEYRRVATACLGRRADTLLASAPARDDVERDQQAQRCREATHRIARACR